MTESARIWTEAAAQAAEKARALRWLVLTIFVVCASLVYVNGYLGPILIPLGRRIFGTQAFTDAENLAAWQGANAALVDLAPLIALGWGLWSANVYLRRVEQGDLWSADALAIFARIGDALWATAGWLIVFAPTLKAWIAMEHRLVFDVEPLSLALAGLGVALSAVARVFAQALRAAADLKAENEAIV